MWWWYVVDGVSGEVRNRSTVECGEGGMMIDEGRAGSGTCFISGRRYGIPRYVVCKGPLINDYHVLLLGLGRMEQGSGVTANGLLHAEISMIAEEDGVIGSMFEQDISGRVQQAVELRRLRGLPYRWPAPWAFLGRPKGQNRAFAGLATEQEAWHCFVIRQRAKSGGASFPWPARLAASWGLAARAVRRLLRALGAWPWEASACWR